ncbi:hypothetical protein OAO87_02920 [bacterium]|nr:hypothetical protein [bacterium]
MQRDIGKIQDRADGNAGFRSRVRRVYLLPYVLREPMMTMKGHRHREL